MNGHSIVIITDRIERSIAVKTILEKKGCRVRVAQGLYEGLRIIDQHLPHVIVAGSIYFDGTIANLQDRLQENPSLSRIPILAWIPTKSKSQLLPLKDRKFSGFILGQASGNTLLAKVKEILEESSGLSPHFVAADRTKVSTALTYKVSVTAEGCVQNYLLLSTGVDLTKCSRLEIKTPSSQQGLDLSFGQEIRRENSYHGLFPIRHIRSADRSWMKTQASFERHISHGITRDLRLLLHFSNQEAAISMAKILSGYEIHAEVAANWHDLKAGLDDEELDGVVVNGFAADCKEVLEIIEWKKREPTPALILLGIGSAEQSIGTGIHCIASPCGLGRIVDQVRMLSYRSDTILPRNSEQASIHIEAKAQLYGLDENGIVIISELPLLVGTQLQIISPDLIELWEGDDKLEVLYSSVYPGEENRWLVFLQTRRSTDNKGKYWQQTRVQLGLEPLPESA